jgi:hypothetical protein
VSVIARFPVLVSLFIALAKPKPKHGLHAEL